MAEISRKRSGELVRGVFQILNDVPEGLPAKEVLRRLEALVPRTEFERHIRNARVCVAMKRLSGSRRSLR